MIILKPETNQFYAEFTELIDQYDNDDMAVNFVYNGKRRLVTPIKVHFDKFSAIDHSDGKEQFKHFLIREMDYIEIVVNGNVSNESSGSESLTEKIQYLEKKLEAIKIFRPQHVPTADALAEVVQNISLTHESIGNYDNVETKQALILSVESMHNTISEQVETLAQ